MRGRKGSGTRNRRRQYDSSDSAFHRSLLNWDSGHPVAGEFSRTLPDQNLNNAVHLTFRYKALFCLQIHLYCTIPHYLGTPPPFRYSANSPVGGKQEPGN